jgi:hypothetical protein
MNIHTKISENKSLLVTIAVALICLFLYSIFPSDNIFQGLISSLTFLLVIPALYIKIILKGSFKSFGVQLGDKQKGLIWMGLSLLTAVLFLYVLLRYTSFSQNYRPPEIIVKSFVFFILYEIFLVGFFTLLYEFFFRGVVMLGIARRLGLWSILVQFLAFLGFFLLTGNFNWSIALYVIISPFAGITAYQSRSLVFSFATSLFFIIIADALAIALTKT